MKKEDLLLFLQDIVEQGGDFTFLYNFHGGKRKIPFNVMQDVIIHGLNNGIFELYQRNSDEKSKTRYIEIDKEKAILIVSDKKSWERWPDFYEVGFISPEKYLWILFGDEVGDKQKVPDEFLKFIVD